MTRDDFLYLCLLVRGSKSFLQVSELSVKLGDDLIVVP